MTVGNTTPNELTNMSNTKTTKKTDPAPSRADIQTTRDSPFVTDIAQLPRSKRSAHTYEWLENAPKGAIFSAKTLAEAGVYKTPAAASSTIMRMHRQGLVKQVMRDGKAVKGAYTKA